MSVLEGENQCQIFKLTSRWSVELDHKFIQSTEDGDLMLTLNADIWFRKRLPNHMFNKDLSGTGCCVYILGSNDPYSDTERTVVYVLPIPNM